MVKTRNESNSKYYADNKFTIKQMAVLKRFEQGKNISIDTLRLYGLDGLIEAVCERKQKRCIDKGCTKYKYSELELNELIDELDKLKTWSGKGGSNAKLYLRYLIKAMDSDDKGDVFKPLRLNPKRFKEFIENVVPDRKSLTLDLKVQVAGIIFTLIRNDRTPEIIPPEGEKEMFDQLYDLTLVMLADGIIEEDEMEFVTGFANQIGFRKTSSAFIVDSILEGMENKQTQNQIYRETQSFMKNIIE